MAKFSFDTESVIEPAHHELRAVPRADNGLLTKVSWDGHQVQAEGVTNDFSLLGLQLRLASETVIPRDSTWVLDIMTPCDSLEEYQRQQPLRVGARMVWSRREGQNSRYGLQFHDLTPAQESRLEACIRYFGKNPRYLESDSISGQPTGEAQVPGDHEGTRLRSRSAAASSS